MDNYVYPYSSSFVPSRPDGEYPDHGDGIGEYYGMTPVHKKRDGKRRSRSVQRKSRQSEDSHSRSRSMSRSRSRSRSRARSRSVTRSRSSRSRTTVRRDESKKLNWTEPSFIDAFRVLYLTPNKQKKNTAKYLVTKKKQDRIQELLKRDGLGSKHWFFYPRPKSCNNELEEDGPEPRANCDQRIKVDGDFFRKYKRTKNLNTSAPIAKLKRWELVFYKKLGFIQAV